MICIHLGWSSSILQFRQNIIKVQSQSLNVSTTPLRQWGFRQCLPFSWTPLSGKHPIDVMGVVDTFGHGYLVLTCSSNITLSLPSYTGSALKRELNFCTGYLSLLYFWSRAQCYGHHHFFALLDHHCTLFNFLSRR